MDRGDWEPGHWLHEVLSGVPFFFKRLGAKAETPADLKIREYPEVQA